jgi:hypothetical protein
MRRRRQMEEAALSGVVQHIVVKWTKRSRGGSGAAKRNAVPEVASLPVVSGEPFSTNALLRHVQFWGEEDEFKAPENDVLILDDLLEIEVGAVTVALDAEARSLLVTFRYDMTKCGAPFRYSGPMSHRMTEAYGRSGPASYRAEPNQWVQVLYNGRFSSYKGVWWYEKHIINAEMFDRVSQDVFTRGEPAHRHDATARLY